VSSPGALPGIIEIVNSPEAHNETEPGAAFGSRGGQHGFAWDPSLHRDHEATCQGVLGSLAVAVRVIQDVIGYFVGGYITNIHQYSIGS
jgi:hypothetical protein